MVSHEASRTTVTAAVRGPLVHFSPEPERKPVSLWENNKGCFLATQTIIKRGVIRAITTSLPCCAIPGGVGSGKTGYPPLFWSVLVVCVRASFLSDSDGLCHTFFFYPVLSAELDVGQRVIGVKHGVTAVCSLFLHSNTGKILSWQPHNYYGTTEL